MHIYTVYARHFSPPLKKGLGTRILYVLYTLKFAALTISLVTLYSAGSDVRVLVGHAGPVYCTSFNTDNSFLVSGSEDGTGECVPTHSFILYQ